MPIILIKSVFQQQRKSPSFVEQQTPMIMTDLMIMNFGRLILIRQIEKSVQTAIRQLIFIKISILCALVFKNYSNNYSNKIVLTKLF